MMTKQKQTILDYFRQHIEAHPTAEDVYTYVKTKEPKIGIATVYRNLNKLVEQGVLRELNLQKQGVHYDLLIQVHDHFICDICKNIENIVLPSLSQIDKEVEKITQGSVLSKHLIYHGICKECLKNKV